jgi:glutathione S-transferase
MKLIGMLDSPYVRRVAISLQLMGLRFEHNPLSVFRTFAEFQRINPVVKAPTLVCDDATVLMDSTLILDYAQALARPRSLWPAELLALQRELRLVGLGLAAMEKSVQLVYEDGLRPAEKRHEPWVKRVTGQLQAAYAELEAELARQPLPAGRDMIGQAGITVTVAWDFTQRVLPQAVPLAAHPRLAAFAAAAETLPEFLAAPFGAGTVRHTG